MSGFWTPRAGWEFQPTFRRSGSVSKHSPPAFDASELISEDFTRDSKPVVFASEDFVGGSGQVMTASDGLAIDLDDFASDSDDFVPVPEGNFTVPDDFFLVSDDLEFVPDGG